MFRTRSVLLLALLLAATTAVPGLPGAATVASAAGSPNAYEELVDLFETLRQLQEVKVVDWVPDYGPAAMTRQYEGVLELAERLAALDTTGWPLEHQVDYQLVRAEINGLIFYQRVLKPWARDPGFYLQTQDGGGPARAAHLSVHEMPIPAAELDEVRGQLRALPTILEQAEANLTEGAADLAYSALHYMPVEIAYHEMLRDALAEHHPDLRADAETAVLAVRAFGDWLAANEHRMTAPAGVGKDNYTWWMKNVQLVPYTWDELYDIIMREDDRVLTTLALMRNRNKDLPELVPVASQDEHAARRREALLSAMGFMEDNDLFEVPDWADMEGYLAGADGRGESWGAYFTNRYVGSGETGEWPGVRDFFHQTADREPMPEQTHEFIGHYFDRQRQARDMSPIRSTDRFYAIDMIRLEGWAFWLEEMMMHAGYLDDRPVRAREVPFWQAAFRTCRAIADLRMHSNEYTLQQAIDYAVDCAPNGWLIPDGPHAWYEMQTNLRYVGWHMGMVVGKLTVNELIAERVRQQGDEFNFRDFFRDFFDAGIMPLSLIRWQMTGLDDEMQQLTDPTS